MAGKKQHYIPQCLLRAFAARSTPKRDYVFVFNNFKDPFLSPTEDVAAQRYFYSDASDTGGTSLDDIITDYENYLAPRLVSLRNAEPDAPIESKLAAEVVAHLTIRTAYLRDVFGMAALGIIDVLEDAFRDPLKLREILGIDAPQPSAQFERALDEALEEIARQLPSEASIPRTFLEEVAIALVREQFGALHANNVRMTTGLLQMVKDRMPELMKNAHRGALGKALVPQERIEALEKYSWSVHVTASANFVLPDCVTLAIGSNGVCAPYVGNDLGSIECVLLPLSPNRVLVGRCRQGVHVSLEHFNCQAAYSSSSFFVSSTTSADLEALTVGIGMHAKSTMVSAIAAARNDLTRTGPGDFKDSNQPSATTLTLQMRFDSAIDQPTASRVAEIVKAVVGQMTQIADLSRLDAIVFAEDFTPELIGLGLPAQVTPDTLALAPIVSVDGSARGTLLLRTRLALMLSQVDDRQLAAAHVLVSMLARIDLATRMDTGMPGILTRPAEDWWESTFAAASCDLLVAYHAARLAAPLYPPIISEYRDGLMTRIQYASKQVPIARTRFVQDKNVAAFLAVAIPCIRSLLEQFARIVGYYDAELNETACEDDQFLRNSLDEVGLWLWLDTYQRDLRQLVDHRRVWRSSKDILRISVHLRRWLLAFGVACWRSDDGNLWLHMNDIRPPKEPFGSAG